jgi:hypothetical protein
MVRCCCWRTDLKAPPGTMHDLLKLQVTTIDVRYGGRRFSTARTRHALQAMQYVSHCNKVEYLDDVM